MGQLKSWSTEGLKTDQALAFWNDAVCSAFLNVQTKRERASSAFHASMQSHDLGSLALNHLQAQAYRVSGGPGTEPQWAFINLHQAGHCRLRQHGREQYLEPGDVSINLGSTPFDFQFADGMRMTCVRLPYAGLAARTLRLHEAAARPLPSEGATALFLGYLRTLVANIEHMPPWQVEQAATCLMDLLAMAIDCHPSAGLPARVSMRDALYQSARLYLGQHYADASLSPATLAAHLNLAPRTLQALFQEHGTTVTESLLSLRLQAAERLLSRERHLLVADIAYHVGFSDLSYFNRAFRRRFGMTPRECRSAE